MLPTEPPLSLHRLLAPVPPARAPETATATRQVPAPAPVSNATMARAAHPPATAGSSFLIGHDQSGNAAVAHAALRAVPDTVPPMAFVPQPTAPGP
ncbi:hypothetical protein ABT174_11235 [Streptomyces sparsogenes]|uniref:hypothetical protein n=1 Tax=Streptomyces sparsogenes TaxID=67365 RepID=UPI0033264AB4